MNPMDISVFIILKCFRDQKDVFESKQDSISKILGLSLNEIFKLRFLFENFFN
jgi:hypothetical protein